MIVPNPLVLFCKENRKGSFYGNAINGFPFKFCDKTKPVQTDVGICITSIPRQFLLDDNIMQQKPSGKNNDGGLKYIEHTMMMIVDKFGDAADESDFKVCNSYCLT